MSSVHAKEKRSPARPRLTVQRKTAAAVHIIPSRSPQPILAMCILLAAVTLLVYSPVAWHPFINYDDDSYVTENSHVTAGLTWPTLAWAMTATDQSNWHPLTWLSHALDSELYGLNAGAHHVTSVVWHALCVVLLFLLLARVTGSIIPSAVVAALFAVHPLNVESVAWVAERKSVLSMFFFLLALGAYGWYARRPDWKRYSAVALFFAMGLTAKPMVITLPFVVLLLDYWPLGRIQGWTKSSPAFPIPQSTFARLVTEKLPLLALSLASGILTVIAQRSGNAVVPLGHLPFKGRIQNALYSYAMYVERMFRPIHLAVLYPHPYPLHRLTFLRVGLSTLILIAISALVWWQRLRRPYLMTGWLWFLGTLIPVIGLIQVGAQGMADRYFYLPGIGLFLMLVWTVYDWSEKRLLNFRIIIRVVTATVLAALCALTFHQLGYWRSSFDLWSHTLAVTHDNFTADDKMGELLMKQGRPEGVHYYEAAAALEPFDPLSHGILASILQDRADFRGAMVEYETALRANHDPSSQAKIYANMGAIYLELGYYEKARENSQRALQLDPKAVQEVIQQLSKLVVAHPSASRYFQVGLLLEGAGEISEARSAYQQALQMNPGYGPAQRALEGLAARRE